MKVSIITINYNDRIGLERTIKSVVTQTYTEIEYIVIDGGSSDGSKEVIEAYSDKIAYWISEKDKGVYNAMNKGILKATGDYLFFLNSGDKFSDDKVLSSFWSAPSDKKIVYGNVNYVHENHIDLITYPSILTFKFWVQGTICHQAVFMHKSCFDVAGLYDEDLKIVSDWKLLIIGYVWHKFTYEYRPVTISDFYADGISSNPESKGLLIKEQQQVLNEYFQMFAKDYADLINLENKARYFNPKILLQKGPQAILRKLKAFIKSMGNILFIGHFIAEYSDAGMARNKAFRDKFTDMDAVIINPYNRNLFLRFCLLIRTLMTLFFAKEKTIFLLQGTFFILFPIGILKYNIINKIVFSLLTRTARRNQLILEVNDLITLQAKDLELQVNPLMRQIEDKLYRIRLCKYVFASNEMRKYAIDKWSIPSTLCNYIINGGTRLNEGVKPLFDNEQLLMVGGPKYIYAGSLNQGRQIEEMISIFKSGDCGCLVLIGIWGDWLLKEDLGKHIVYLGNFNEETAHYITSCCDFGLNPYDETRLYYNLCFPSKASFYITAGIPVLSTPLTELKTFMKDTDAGIFLSINKWPDFLNTMDGQKLLWYKKQASKMREKMSWEFIMKKVDTIVFNVN